MGQEYHQFILQREKRQKTKAHVEATYFAFVADQKYRNVPEDKLKVVNKLFIQTFGNTISGNFQKSSQIKEQEKSREFQEQSLGTARLFIKECWIKGESARLIYMPIDNYQLDKYQNIQESYRKMVNQFFFLNMFLHYKCTRKVKIFAMMNVVKSGLGFDDSEQFDLNLCKQEGLQFAKNQFNLQYKQLQSKLTFLLIVKAKKHQFALIQTIQKEDFIYNQTFVYTKDTNPLNKLQITNGSWKLNQTDNQKVLNHNTISILNFHKLFHYRRFVRLNVEYESKVYGSGKQIKKNKQQQKQCKVILAKIKQLDISVAQELWAPIQNILKPISYVKEAISRKCDQKFNCDKKIWPGKIQEASSLKQFNVSCGFDKWISKFQVKAAQKQEAIQSNDPFLQVLNKFTSCFVKYDRFSNQDANLIYAMILDHINQIQTKIIQVKQNILNAPSKHKQIQQQRAILPFCKIVLRLLSALKPYELFRQIFENYEPQFYEHLLDALLNSYEEFSIASRNNFGRISNLYVKLNNLKTNKKDLLLVVMRTGDIKELFRDGSRINTPGLLKKQQLLKIMLRLLIENKPQEKDNDHDVKVFRTKYDLGSTLHKIALQLEPPAFQQQNDQSYQKEALRLLFNELYVPIFTIQKNLLQYKDTTNFSQQQLLQKISAILRILKHMDLSIEVEKKLRLEQNVANYYNRWLAQYQRFDPKINSILQQAIKYFSVKFDTQKVKSYYNSLIKNCKTGQQKRAYEMRKYDYQESYRSQASSKKLINRARDTLFNLSKETIQKIQRVHVVQVEEQRIR